MEKINNKETISLRVQVAKKLFYNEKSMYGVFSFYPMTNKDKININPSFGTFVVNGNTPPLQDYEEYDIEVVPSKHPKYGNGYTFVSVKLPRPTTIEQQQNYVRSIITEKQYEAIIEAYPNHFILDLIENDELDYSKIKGIKEKSFAKIKEKLLENMEINQILVELKDLELTPNAIKKLLEHFGSSAAVVETAQNNIYEFCKVSGFGFKTIDKFALNRGDDPTSHNRIEAAISYLLYEDSSKTGHSWIHKDDLIKGALELLDIQLSYIIDSLEKIKKDEDTDIYIDTDIIALKKNYHYEKEIYKTLIAMLKRPCKSSNVDGEEKVRELEKENGFEYTSEQREAIKKAINNNVLVINGKAGSGKTFTLKGVLRALSDYSYMTCSLSGKAVKVLTGNGLLGKTIHRMLGYQGEFSYNKENPLPYDIVVIDESSMVNNYLMYSVVTALKDDAKIIFVGDNGQLPSIGTGAVFDDLLNSEIIPKQELTKVHRQASKSGILEVANKIREGEQINKLSNYKTQVFGELQDMALIPTDDETDMKDLIVNISKKNIGKDIYDFQVITGVREKGELSVKALNKELQKIFNNKTSKDDEPYVERNEYQYRIGDKIIQNGNNYEATIMWGEETEDDEPTTTEVYNGTMGKIVAIELDEDKTKQNHKVYIKFEDVSDVIIYDKDELSQIEMAYAITTHKSQGATIKNVLFAFDFSSYMLLCKEFVYTGITRASEGCVMVANNKALRMAIEKTQGSTRRTFLKEFFKGE